MHFAIFAHPSRICAVLCFTTLLMLVARAGGPTLVWERVGSPPGSITNVVFSPLSPTRTFVTTQDGQVLRLDNRNDETLLLDLEPRVLRGAERGLLGMAFHPDFEQNHFVFLLYVHADDNISRVSRFTMDPESDIIDPDSETVIMRFGADSPGHRGGWIGFGPDGMLYIASGDHLRSHQARTPDNELGTLMRIDVDRDDFHEDPEQNYAIPDDNPFADGLEPRVWHYGLRNPWRCSFDVDTGTLYIADVMASDAGEINVVGLTGGLDFGWPCYEGNDEHLTLPECENLAAVMPQVTRSTFGDCATIGGYVYRGCEFPTLRGRYFFTDNCNSELYSFEYNDGAATDLRLHVTSGAAPFGPRSFGVDADGELYLAAIDAVYRLRRFPLVRFDCNQDGIADSCQLADGTLADADGDRVPDVCECPNETESACDTDVDGDCKVDYRDLGAVLAGYMSACGEGSYNPFADINDDCAIDDIDLNQVLIDYLNDCSAG